MRPLRLRKRERLARVSRRPLTQRTSRSAPCGRSPRSFCRPAGGFPMKRFAVGVPKVREASAGAVALGNLLPQPRAGVGATACCLSCPRSSMLRRARARRLRGPARVCRPAPQLTLFLSQRESVLRLTPKTRSIPRIVRARGKRAECAFSLLRGSLSLWVEHAVGPAALAVVLLVAAGILAFLDDVFALALPTMEGLGLLDHNAERQLCKTRVRGLYA